MTATLCSCGKPIRDNATICWPCTNRLERELGDIPALLAEIDNARLRQARTGGRSAGGRPGTRSGYDQLPDSRPTQSLDRLRNELVGWARILVEEGGHSWPRDTVASVARFVQAGLPWLRRHEGAAEAVTGLTAAVAGLRHSIDRQADRIYAGPCNAPLEDGSVCQQHLTTTRGAREIHCDPRRGGCDAKYDPSEQSAWLLAAAEDQLAPAFVLAQAVTRLGQTVPAGTIRQWALRGRLLEHGLDLDGHPLYRVGDVLDLIAAEAARRAKQAIAKDHDRLSRDHGRRTA